MLIIIEVPHTLQNVNFAAKERVLKSAFQRMYKNNQLKKLFSQQDFPLSILIIRNTLYSYKKVGLWLLLT